MRIGTAPILTPIIARPKQVVNKTQTTYQECSECQESYSTATDIAKACQHNLKRLKDLFFY